MTDNEIRKLVLEAIAKAAKEDIEDTIRPSWIKLQEQAQYFLYNYNLLQLYDKKIFNSQLLNAVIESKGNFDVNNIEKKLIDVKNKYEQSAVDKSAYLLASRFSDYIDLYRGKINKRLAAYVTANYSDEDGIYNLATYEMPIIDLISMSTTGGRIKIEDTSKKLQKYKTLEENIIDGKHIIEAKLAYTAVRNRVQVYYDKKGLKGNDAKGGKLLWKENGDWNMAKIASWGSLAEGYVGFLLDKHKSELCSISPGSSPYYNHEFVKTFYYDYISKITNLSALIEEDIIAEGKEYAVKKHNAELPDFSQYLKVAKYIISNDEPTYFETHLRILLDKNEIFNPKELISEVKDKAVKKAIKEVQKVIDPS